MTDGGDPRTVEVLDGYVGSPPALFDAASGEYFDLWPDDQPDPATITLPPPGLRGEGVRVVVVDTGVMSRHPLLRDRLVAAVDFTGEGPEDLNGHGTAVALVLMHTTPGCDLISAKCISGSGRGRPEDLVRALDWVRSTVELPAVVNVSAGIDSRRWLFFPCDGTCSVCRATRRLLEAGFKVAVAAGNKPRATLCPARLERFGVVSVGGESRKQQFNSGAVNVDVPILKAIPIVPRLDPPAN